MKKFSLCCILLLSLSFSLAVAQRNGIGIRLGEPSAITYKRYLADNKALEFLIGTAPNSLGDTYYRTSLIKKYDDYTYVDHEVSEVFYLQGRYQFNHQIPTEGLAGKLDWYWGIGAAFKTAKLEYVFKDEFQDLDILSRSDLDVGPEIMGGFEFTLQNTPLAVFAEMSTFIELADRTTIRVLGGFGARYNF